MRLARLSRLAAIVAVAAIEISCGDVFRPIAIPQNPNPPDPESLHFALVVTDDGTQNPGASSRIDVSGDTNVGTARMGIGPVHAAMLPSGAAAFVANQGDDTVSSYATSIATAVNTITLPPGSAPSYVHTTQTDTVYVANAGSATISVINALRNVVTQTIGVGTNPIALAETPDSKRLYVVNQGSNSVTAVNVVDKTVNATIPVGSGPILAAARSDSARVYILSQGSGTISVIDTATDTVLGAPVSVGAANFMYYEKNLNRLYLTVPGSGQLVVVNVAADPPVVLPNVDLTTSCPGCVLDGVTALPNKLRAYVSSHQISVAGPCVHVDNVNAPDINPPCITTLLTTIKVPENTVLGTAVLPHQVIPGAPPVTRPDVTVVPACDSARVRRYIASAVDSTRVYVANCDGGTTDIVRTSDDSFVLGLPAPFSQSAPGNNGSPPPQNPVFVVPGPK